MSNTILLVDNEMQKLEANHSAMFEPKMACFEMKVTGLLAELIPVQNFQKYRGGSVAWPLIELWTKFWYTL